MANRSGRERAPKTDDARAARRTKALADALTQAGGLRVAVDARGLSDLPGVLALAELELAAILARAGADEERTRESRQRRAEAERALAAGRKRSRLPAKIATWGKLPPAWPAATGRPRLGRDARLVREAEMRNRGNRLTRLRDLAFERSRTRKRAILDEWLPGERRLRQRALARLRRLGEDPTPAKVADAMTAIAIADAGGGRLRESSLRTLGMRPRSTH